MQLDISPTTIRALSLGFPVLYVPHPSIFIPVALPIRDGLRMKVLGPPSVAAALCPTIAISPMGTDPVDLQLFERPLLIHHTLTLEALIITITVAREAQALFPLLLYRQLQIHQVLQRVPHPCHQCGTTRT